MAAQQDKQELKEATSLQKMQPGVLVVPWKPVEEMRAVIVGMGKECHGQSRGFWDRCDAV